MKTQDQWTATLNQNDVLFGRGSGPSEHAGNLLFRDLVNRRKEAYKSTNQRQVKSKLAQQVVDAIYASNGRFLRRVEDPKEARRLGIPADLLEAYCFVNDAAIMEKAKQALRQNPYKSVFATSKKPEMRPSVKNNPTTGSPEKIGSAVNDKRSFAPSAHTSFREHVRTSSRHQTAMHHRPGSLENQPFYYLDQEVVEERLTLSAGPLNQCSSGRFHPMKSVDCGDACYDSNKTKGKFRRNTVNANQIKWDSIADATTEPIPLEGHDRKSSLSSFAELMAAERDSIMAELDSEIMLDLEWDFIANPAA